MDEGHILGIIKHQQMCRIQLGATRRQKQECGRHAP